MVSRAFRALVPVLLIAGVGGCTASGITGPGVRNVEIKNDTAYAAYMNVCNYPNCKHIGPNGGYVLPGGSFYQAIGDHDAQSFRLRWDSGVTPPVGSVLNGDRMVTCVGIVTTDSVENQYLLSTLKPCA